MARGRKEHSPVATGRPPGAARADGSATPHRAGQQRLRLTVGRQASSVLPVASSRPATAIRLRPTSTSPRAGPRLGRQRLARRQHRPVRRQGVLLAADLGRQVGQLEVGLRQGPPRSDVGLLAEQGPELAVEVGRRFQEPVAQVLELLLLEQEVLADSGVERLDRVDGQLVPLLRTRWLAARQFGVGPRLHGDDGGRLPADDRGQPQPPTGAPARGRLPGTTANCFARRRRPAGRPSPARTPGADRSSARPWPSRIGGGVLLQALHHDPVRSPAAPLQLHGSARDWPRCWAACHRVSRVLGRGGSAARMIRRISERTVSPPNGGVPVRTRTA